MERKEEAYSLFVKTDPEDPKRFARAVADPKNKYPEWLRVCAVEFIATSQ